MLQKYNYRKDAKNYKNTDIVDAYIYFIHVLKVQLSIKSISDEGTTG